MSTPLDPLTLLAGLPKTLREELINEYSKILTNYREERWEPAELDGGRFCEIVYSILNGYINRNYPSRSSKPGNFLEACKQLEATEASKAPRSVRVQIPRLLVTLYEIRNNRGVGHVGGEVDPNHMDATLVVSMVKWTLAELIRIFHSTDTASAFTAVEVITEREVPLLWQVEGKCRVLDPKLSKTDQTLLLLYRTARAVRESDLFDWIEHSNPTVYRRDVLKRLHKNRFVEYDRTTGAVTISPTGIKHVERKLLAESPIQ